MDSNKNSLKTKNVNIESTTNAINKKNLADNKKEILKSVYGNYYEQTIKNFKEMEDKTKNFFNNLIIDLDKNYKVFNSNIQKHFVYLTNKCAKAFKLDENIDEQKTILIQNYTKENLDQLIKINNMQEQILNSIQETISILIKSFDISKSLDEEKPIQHFLEKEFENIVNSWLFIKIDIEKLNFAKSINNSNLDNSFKEYI